MTKPDAKDEADILALNEKLTADLATAQASIFELGEKVAALELNLESVKAENVTLSEKIKATEAETIAIKAEKEELEKKSLDFDKSVAASVAKLGISATPITSAQEPVKPLTETEKCRQARGV